MLNAPYNGGTHLPDVTVITPVFDDGTGQRASCSTSARAAITPTSAASRPARCRRTARVVEEEGVLIDNFLLVERGRLREQETIALLASGRYPARNIEQNMADLRAMIAANEKGVQELRRMVEHFGLDVVHAYMRHVQDNAEESVRRVIDVLKDGAVLLRDGQRRRDHASRSASTRPRAAPRSTSPAPAPQLANNFNAPSAVCMAAVLYVFRTLVDDDIPLNAGLPEAARRDHSRGLDAATRAIRRRWSRAMSRPRSASPTRSTARSA